MLKKPVKPPEEFAHILFWYGELRGANPYGFRFEPLSHTEILAYKTLYELEMDGLDVELLRRVDGIWMKAQPAASSAPSDTPKKAS